MRKWTQIFTSSKRSPAISFAEFGWSSHCGTYQSWKTNDTSVRNPHSPHQSSDFRLRVKWITTFLWSWHGNVGNSSPQVKLWNTQFVCSRKGRNIQFRLHKLHIHSHISQFKWFCIKHVTFGSFKTIPSNSQYLRPVVGSFNLWKGLSNTKVTSNEWSWIKRNAWITWRCISFWENPNFRSLLG